MQLHKISRLTFHVYISSSYSTSHQPFSFSFSLLLYVYTYITNNIRNTVKCKLIISFDQFFHVTVLSATCLNQNVSQQSNASTKECLFYLDCGAQTKNNKFSLKFSTLTCCEKFIWNITYSASIILFTLLKNGHRILH